MEKLQNNILQSAKEAVGVRKISINNKRNRKPWFTPEIKVRANEAT